MNKYLKNVKLRLGVLTVEVALIFSLVIVVGHFFLPGNGLMEHVGGIIDVVLGRVTSDTGDYRPNGSGEVPEPPNVKDPTAMSIVTEALKEAFTGTDCKDATVLQSIIRVQIAENNKVFIQTSANGNFETLENHFRGNGSDIIMKIIKRNDGGDTVKPGIYDFKLE